MAPVSSSLASKLNLLVKSDDSFTTDGKTVICLGCNESIGCSMKSQLEQHVRSALHKKNKQFQFFEEASTLNIDAAIFDLKK
jgi:hypothetical protein